MANQVNPAGDPRVKEIDVVSGIKVIETEYRIKVPVFEDVQVERPTFVDKVVEVPVGIDALVEQLTLKIADKLMDKVEIVLQARLDRAIDQRVKEIKSPRIVEEVNVVYKDVPVERPIFTDITVDRPIFKDYEVKNPILKDVEVVNAVVADRTVVNAIITDQKITNAIIKDVEVERAIIREKVIDVIHPRYLKMNGEPE